MIKIKDKYIIIIIFSFLSYITGCASISFKVNPDRPTRISPGIYRGVRDDIESIKDPGDGAMWVGPIITGIASIVMAMDILPSFVLDTICLPYDIMQIQKDKKKKIDTKIKRAHVEYPDKIIIENIEYKTYYGIGKKSLQKAYIEARNLKTKIIIWKKEIYQSVQWVMITKVERKDNKLLISNEKEQRFSLDLETLEVEKIK